MTEEQEAHAIGRTLIVADTRNIFKVLCGTLTGQIVRFASRLKNEPLTEEQFAIILAHLMDSFVSLPAEEITGEKVWESLLALAKDTADRPQAMDQDEIDKLHAELG